MPSPMRPLLDALFRRKPHERAGFALYTAAVTAARRPWFFAAPPDGAGAPDTLNGRFDVVGLHVALLIRRLRAEPADPRGAALAQSVFDAMFSDMDINLREMGVGDMVVGKRVRRMWEAFHGRALAYEAALEAADPLPPLADALLRNLWRVEPGAEAAAALREGALALAAQAARGIAGALAAQDISALLRGQVTFPPPPPSGRAGAAPAGPREVVGHAA
jgi:cytochrome b pre-mRNA-processing protein 3